MFHVMERNQDIWTPCLDDMDSYYMVAAAPIYQMQYQLLAGQSYAANPSAPSNSMHPRAITPLTDSEDEVAHSMLTSAPLPMSATDPLNLNDLPVIMTNYNPMLKQNQKYPWKNNKDEDDHNKRFKWTEKARKLAEDAECYDMAFQQVIIISFNQILSGRSHLILEG